jgi:excisionase family DNA binding protein
MRQTKPSDVEDVAIPLPLDGRLAVSINETCKALGVQRDKVYELIRQGEPEGLVASQIGRRTLVHVDSILRLLKRTRITSRKMRVRRVRHGAVTQLTAP